MVCSSVSFCACELLFIIWSTLYTLLLLLFCLTFHCFQVYHVLFCWLFLLSTAHVKPLFFFLPFCKFYTDNWNRLIPYFICNLLYIGLLPFCFCFVHIIHALPQITQLSFDEWQFDRRPCISSIVCISHCMGFCDLYRLPFHLNHIDIVVV